MTKNKEDAVVKNGAIVELGPGKVETQQIEQQDPSLAPAVAEGSQVAVTVGEDFAAHATLSCSRVKIAYAVSQNMPDDAPEGSLVISTSEGGWSRLLAANAKEPLTVLIMQANRYYKEWLTSDQFNAGQRPRRYATMAAAKADGQTTEWVNGQKPSVSLALDVQMLVRRPDDVADCGEAFNLIIDGQPWAPCIMTVDKAGAQGVNAFLSNLLMRDATQRKISLRSASLFNSFCTLKVTAKPFKNNPSRKARVPTFGLKLDDKYQVTAPSEEFRKELATLLSCLADPSKNATDTGDEDNTPF